MTYQEILDKVNKPAIAAKLAGIKNIIGPGFKNQKKWITVKNYLDEKDWKCSFCGNSNPSSFEICWNCIE